jgi:thioredoxin-related protein
MKSSFIIIVLLLLSSFTSQTDVPKRYHLLIFEGSDWCPNCIRLEKNILTDNVFIRYLDRKNIELIKIDFPQQRKLSAEQKLNNEQTAEKYNFEGIFPTIIISRSDTLLFEKIYYQNQSVEEIKALIERKLQFLQ